MNQEGLPKLGAIEVATTNYGGHPPEFWAEGDYWLGEDGKRYRLAGHRCINKETGKEIFYGYY